MFKTRLDTFGIDFGHFWYFEYFLFFFRKLSMNPWNNEQKNFSKKIALRHVWTLLETIKSNLWILMFFWMFWKFSKARPSMEHWAKLFFGKIAPKHVQSKFRQNWEQFWAFLDFWIFSKTRTSMEHWGNFFFEKNAPKHVWTLENDFGQF